MGELIRSAVQQLDRFAHLRIVALPLLGYQNQVALVSLLSNNPAFNPWAAQQSPALAAQIRATNYNGEMINSTLTNDALNARISGDLYPLPAGMAKFAFGGALVDENLKYD